MNESAGLHSKIENISHIQLFIHIFVKSISEFSNLFMVIPIFST